MSANYNPRNWYWIVGESATQVYSSAVGNYVAVSDITYQGWLADGTLPSRIASEAELGEVLAPYALRPVHAGVLDGYRDSQAGKLTIETIAKVMFDMESRIRALEGFAARNVAGFRAYVKGVM